MPEYHAWTHRPKAQGGTDPIEVETGEWPWIVISNGTTDVDAANNTIGSAMPLCFTDLLYDPNLVTEGDIWSWAQTDSGDTGNDRWVLSTERVGWYAYEMRTAWFQVTTAGANATGSAFQRLNPVPGTTYGWQDNDWRSSATWNNSGNFEMLHNNYLVTQGIAHMLGQPREWQALVWQTTGSDRTCDGLYLKMFFLADSVPNPSGTEDDWVIEIVS